jgi:hypothetical protein
MKGMILVLIVGIVFGTWTATALAQTMRCGNDFIQINDSSFIVVKKCGEPVSKVQVGHTIDQGGNRELLIEEWVYGPVKRYYYFVTMTGGRVSDIRSERP